MQWVGIGDPTGVLTPVQSVPAFIAMFALAVPPMLANAYVGMASVDDEIRESARGMGMNARQMIWQVELPNAVPLIMAGVRTATVAVVATATLAAYVDSGGFGRYIVDGFRVNDDAKVFAGGLLVALLAIALELLLALLQRAITSPGIRSEAKVRVRDAGHRSRPAGAGPRPLTIRSSSVRPSGNLTDSLRFLRHRSGVGKCPTYSRQDVPMTHARFRRRAWALLTAGLLTLVVGLTAGGVASAQSKSLTVGSKDFGGAQAISQAYGQALENKGYDISFKDNLGATEIVYAALQNGDLDGYADYQGTLLQYLGGEATGDSATTYKALTEKLAGTGIVASKPAPAVDVNGFYVTKATAKKYKLKKVSDLKKVAGDLTFGGPPECEERDLCLGAKSKELYGLDFSEVKKLDAGGPITVKALDDGDIDVALLFTGSSVIPKDAVLLTDDKGLQPADNPVFLIKKDKATAATMKILNKVSAKLTTAAYNKMSLGINEDKQDPADVATAFLKKNGLG